MPSIISPGLLVAGNLVCEGDIQVEGTIEGDVKARVVTVGEAGSIIGHVVGERVVVSGKIDGRISAPTVILHKSAKVFGDIAHETVTVEAGAHFEGHCTRLRPEDVTAQAEKTFAAVKRELQRVAPKAAESAKGAESGRPPQTVAGA